jgi:hypothetical protein
MALTDGATVDIDAVETSEWLEALDAVVVHDGPDDAQRRGATARGRPQPRALLRGAELPRL